MKKISLILIAVCIVNLSFAQSVMIQKQDSLFRKEVNLHLDNSGRHLRNASTFLGLGAALSILSAVIASSSTPEVKTTISKSGVASSTVTNSNNGFPIVFAAAALACFFVAASQIGRAGTEMQHAAKF